MFSPEVYRQRRKALASTLSGGIAVFPGNRESPMNYPANAYPFRQDSSFLYYFGIQQPDLAGIIDIDEGTETIFGNEPGMHEIIWIGSGRSLKETCGEAGIDTLKPSDSFQETLKGSLKGGRKVHLLPPYREEHRALFAALSDAALELTVSQELIRAVAAQRSVKQAEEIEEQEKALGITRHMHLAAMKTARPGLFEYEVFAAVQNEAAAAGGRLGFPAICTVKGQTLHNLSYNNQLKAGDLLILDGGGETAERYTGDITRVTPVGGTFSEKQKEIYQIVLKGKEEATALIKPGIPYRDVHLHAAKVMAEGLKSVGLMKGNTDDAVEQGAHALFFPHGFGHLLGLDVHDMESLGEDFVGYDTEIERDSQFGLAYLRLGRRLKENWVVTAEPGIYFIPELIDQWQAKNHLADFIHYEKLDEYRSFGGIRLEDNILVTAEGYRVLGEPIPITISEVEAAAST